MSNRVYHRAQRFNNRTISLVAFHELEFSKVSPTIYSICMNGVTQKLHVGTFGWMEIGRILSCQSVSFMTGQNSEVDEIFAQER